MSEFSEALTRAIAKRNERKGEGDSGLYLGEKIMTSIPVDSTSYIRVPLHCTFLEALGISDLPWEDIPNAKYSPAGSDEELVEGRRSPKPRQKQGDNRREGNRRFRVRLRTPIPYTWKSEGRECEWLSFRLPPVVTIVAIGYFLWKYPSAEKRPSVWASEREVYNVIPIELSDLGEMTNKVELPEGDQVTLTEDEQKAEEPTKIRAPGSTKG